MGRLRKKRPASPKKKKKAAAGEDDIDSVKGDSEETAAEAPAPNRVAAAKREAPKPVKPSSERVQPVFWLKTTQFLREVKVELKKVTWPSRKEAMASTAVVIVLVIIVSAFLGLVDVGLSSLVRLVLH